MPGTDWPDIALKMLTVAAPISRHTVEEKFLSALDPKGKVHPMKAFHHLFK